MSKFAKVFFFFFSAVHLFFFSISPLTRAWPSLVKWLCQLKSFILLCLFFKGSLFCTHWTTVAIQVACVQDFGGSKRIVGFPLHSHSCSSLDHTGRQCRRVEKPRRTGGVCQLSNIYCLQSYSCVFVLATLKIRGIRKKINERLTVFLLLGDTELEINLQLLSSEAERYYLVTWTQNQPHKQTNESFHKIKAGLMGGVGGHA